MAHPFIYGHDLLRRVAHSSRTLRRVGALQRAPANSDFAENLMRNIRTTLIHAD